MLVRTHVTRLRYALRFVTGLPFTHYGSAHSSPALPHIPRFTCHRSSLCTRLRFCVTAFYFTHGYAFGYAVAHVHAFGLRLVAARGWVTGWVGCSWFSYVHRHLRFPFIHIAVTAGSRSLHTRLRGWVPGSAHTAYGSHHLSSWFCSSDFGCLRLRFRSTATCRTVYLFLPAVQFYGYLTDFITALLHFAALRLLRGSFVGFAVTYVGYRSWFVYARLHLYCVLPRFTRFTRTFTLRFTVIYTCFPVAFTHYLVYCVCLRTPHHCTAVVTVHHHCPLRCCTVLRYRLTTPIHTFNTPFPGWVPVLHTVHAHVWLRLILHTRGYALGSLPRLRCYHCTRSWVMPVAT